VAQADRFRQRAIALAAEAAALRSRLDSIESCSLWQAMAPVRGITNLFWRTPFGNEPEQNRRMPEEAGVGE